MPTALAATLPRLPAPALASPFPVAVHVASRRKQLPVIQTGVTELQLRKSLRAAREYSPKASLYLVPVTFSRRGSLKSERLA